MRFIFVFILIISSNLYSQNSTYTCDEIKKIIDTKIYQTLPNRKIIARFDKVLGEHIHKIVFDENKFIYVTKTIMKKIKKSIKKNKCDGIFIKEIDKESDPNIKVIRYQPK